MLYWSILCCCVWLYFLLFATARQTHRPSRACMRCLQRHGVRAAACRGPGTSTCVCEVATGSVVWAFWVCCVSATARHAGNDIESKQAARARCVPWKEFKERKCMCNCKYYSNTRQHAIVHQGDDGFNIYNPARCYVINSNSESYRCLSLMVMAVMGHFSVLYNLVKKIAHVFFFSLAQG